MASVDGKAGIIMDRYAIDSKNIVALQNGNIDFTPEYQQYIHYLNEKSVSDLKEIQRMMLDKKVWVNDLQFLISNNGDVVIADPQDVKLGKKPSTNNKAMLIKLIQAAEEQIGK